MPLVDERHLKFLDRQIRITIKDLRQHGFHSGCPRCADFEFGRMRSNKHHTAECRLAMYPKFEAANDPKVRVVKNILEKCDANEAEAAPRTNHGG